MDYNSLKSANPRLFLDGVARGAIDYSNLSDQLATGGPAAAPLVEGILGGPFPPVSYSFNPSNGIPIGANAAYSRPWKSASQKLQDDQYNSFIGPYARLIGFVDSDTSNIGNQTCTSSNPQGILGGGFGIWGRVGLLTSGIYSGSVGFYPQNWYNINEGNNDHNFWSDQYNLTGNGRWTSKKEWWIGTSKKTITGYYMDYLCEIEVAVSNPGFDDPEYYKGLDLSARPDFSIDVTILSTMVAVAAAARWIF